MQGQSAELRMGGYRSAGMAAVQGWFEDESAEVIEALLLAQLADGVVGDVAEIGVHHGKSFLLLANGTREGERAVALDVFDDQSKNLDQSGRGDRAQFEANAATWAPDADVVVLQRSSLEVSEGDAAEVFGRLRLMSVDGGHTAEITCHDLRLAQAAVVDDGVVVLDDLLNAHWLGVLSGVSAYFGEGGTLVPFAYSSNKLYLAPSSAVADHYRDRLRTAVPDLLGKTDVEFFGERVDIYGQGSLRRRRVAEQARVAATAQEQLMRQLDDERRRRLRSEERLAAVRSDLRALRVENSRLKKHRARARAELAAMRASTSWRVTGLPRRAAAVLRSVTRRAS